MAVNPLATVADLDARGIDTTDTTLVDTLLEVASATVRDAAGVPITETTQTLVLATPNGRRLSLPRPVRSVSKVLLDGEQIDDWALRGGELWRRSPWQCRGDIPGEVEVTLTFGFAEPPADIVDLVCNLVGAGVRHADEGYASRKPGLAGESESIDDYSRSEQYAHGQDAAATPMELPDRTREALAARFGGGIVMLESRS